MIAVHDREIRAVSVSFKLPSVIRLLRFVKIKRRFDYVPFSRANIYARDNHTCQYCSEVYPTSDLTFDHVVPVAQTPARGRVHRSARRDGGTRNPERLTRCTLFLSV